MSFAQTRNYIKTHWQVVLWYVGLFVVLGGALFWQLGSLVPGYSVGELASYESGTNLSKLLDNPFNAPFALAIKGVSYLIHDSLLATRLVAVGGGLLVLGAFAALLRHWHDNTTAILGTLLFGLSAWFLHIARLGTPEVLQFGVFLLVAAGFWLRRTNHWLALAVCFLLVVSLVYVPGMIWFIAVGLVWQWKTIDAVFKKHLVTVSLAGLVLLAALVPLAWSLYKHHILIKSWLGLPETWPAPLEILKNAAKVPFHLFVHNSANAETWLGTAPILDVFTLSMFLLGVYLYLRYGKLLRTRLFIVLGLMLTALMAIGSSATFTVIMPFVYLVAAGGLAYLLGQWFKVFPRNPLARSLGWAGISVLVGLACGFQLVHYFVGWPHVTATHETFFVKQNEHGTLYRSNLLQ
ncbi:MAG TPA: hypothetical protein VF733_02855 [Candidatus Saccharimonadales bacterium]